MPGLVMFHRRWRIGSDDFVFPALADLILRIFWFCVILVEFLKYRKTWDCGGGHPWLHTYVKYSLIGLSIVMFLDILIAWTSAKGTIVQDKPRRHLPKILYLRLLVMISEAVWNGFGTKWAFTLHDHSCEPRELVIFVQVVCSCSWVVLVCSLVSILLVFDPNGRFRSSHAHRVADVERNEPQPMYINLNTSPNVDKAKKVWEWQLRMFCCCCKRPDDQSETAYSAISKLFARHFEEDLVPSDIAVGLILLQQKESSSSDSPNRAASTSENTSVQSPDSATSTGAVQGSILSSPGAFSPPSGQSWMSPEMASHFLKFALGSYGWPMFLYNNCCPGLCRIGTQLRCRCCCVRPPMHLSDDDCLECHSAALRAATGLRDEDLVFASFGNRVYEPPFFVALDHASRCVVVAVRGTLSPSDALTDLTADSDALRCCDACPQGAACHRGMLRAALFVARRLDESRALSQALALHQGYSLAVTGHSLGAGVAALLALLLRPTHPGLRCFAFSPPGGLLSSEAARHSEDSVMSVVVGDDVVPRLSVPNVEDLKRRILGCIEACHAPKYKVFVGQLAKCFGKTQKESDVEAESNSRPLLEQLGRGGNHYATNGSQSSDGSFQAPKPPSAIPFYLPGRILHVTRTRSGFQARWVTSDHFGQILVSPRMLSDHMPHAVDEALRRVTHAFGP